MAKKDFEEYPDEGIPDGGHGLLPPWWNWLTVSCVLFALVFPVVLHNIMGWSQKKQYHQEVAFFEQQYPQESAGLNNDGSNPFRDNAESIASGEKIFQRTCAVCHKSDLSGEIGPNLVDNVWLHGDNDSAVFKVIMGGVAADQILQDPPKGTMPAHKESVGAKGVLEVMAFLANKNKSLKPN